MVYNNTLDKANYADFVLMDHQWQDKKTITELAIRVIGFIKKHNQCILYIYEQSIFIKLFVSLVIKVSTTWKEQRI